MARTCSDTLNISMKPARGSGRASTRGPRRTAERKTDKRSQKSKPIASSTAENRVVARNNKNQQSWKPLSKSVLLALENMLGLSILSVLTLRRKEKEESQQHLNILKNQFLAKCALLPVPPRTYGDMMHISHQFRAESLKSEQGKKTLKALEENIDSVFGALQEMEVKMDGLEEKCRVMRSRLEEEEENRKEFLQLSEQTVLHLPALLPQSANEVSLQERIMKMVTNPCAVVKDLQMTSAVEDISVFLELAHKQVDGVQASNSDNL